MCSQLGVFIALAASECTHVRASRDHTCTCHVIRHFRVRQAERNAEYTTVSSVSVLLLDTGLYIPVIQIVILMRYWQIERSASFLGSVPGSYW